MPLLLPLLMLERALCSALASKDHHQLAPRRREQNTGPEPASPASGRMAGCCGGTDVVL